MQLKRPASHVTGDGGERLFFAGIPFEWVPEKQTSDYGIDYFVMVPEAYLVSGIRFGAQVKTKPKHARVDGLLRVEIEVHHLKYWLDDEVHPVFLAACDLKDRAVYYADVDDLVPSLPPSWREQKTVTVSVSPDNSVGAHDRFLAAVRQAWARRMGPQAAVLRRQKEMQKVDPRFRIRITASEEGESHELIAREDVKTALRVTIPIADREKIERLLRGHRVEFAPGEATMEDMPLLRELHEIGGSVEIAAKTEAILSLIASDGAREGAVRNIPTTIVRSIRAIRFEGKLPGTPLSVDLACDIRKKKGDQEENDAPDENASAEDPTSDTLPVRFGLGMDASVWFGHRVADLVGFAALHEFCALCHAGANIRVVAHLPGHDIRLGEHRITPNGFAEPWKFLEFVRQAREVAADASINPILPSSLSPEETEQVRRVHALLFGGEYRAPGKNWTFTLTGKATGEIDTAEGEISMRMIGPPQQLPFLGTTVPVHTREVMLTRAYVKRQRKKKRGGSTVFTLDSKDGEFIERSDRYTAFDWTVP